MSVKRFTINEPRVCFCPASIAWIKKHLMKSARAQFKKLIGRNTSFVKVTRGNPIIFKKGRKSTGRRMFSPKQLAAQRLFAKRARAGTLRRGRKRRSRNSRR